MPSGACFDARPVRTHNTENRDNFQKFFSNKNYSCTESIRQRCHKHFGGLMKLANLPQLPTISYPHQGPNQMRINYVGPKTEKKHLGNIPNDVSGKGGLEPDHHSSCQPAGGGQEVWRDQPVLDASGSPVLEPKVAVLDVKPISSLGYTTTGAVLGGFLGGVVGFAIGCMGNSVLGQAAPMIAGPLVGGLAGGLLGHRSASNDRVRLEWVEKDIENSKLESFSGHHSYANGGYRYSANFETTKLGTYWEPEAVHYDARTGKVRNLFTNDCGPL